MAVNSGLVLVALVVIVAIAIVAIPDVMACKVDLGQSCDQYDQNFNCISYSHTYIDGRTTIREYLFGGSCRGLALGTSVASPIPGIL